MPDLIQFRALVTLYGTSSYALLFGADRFSLSTEEAAELSHAMWAFSPALRAKMQLLLVVAGNSSAKP